MSYTYTMVDDDLETFDVAGAADFLKMSKDTVMRKARTGEVPGTKVGKHWVFIKYDLIKLIRSRYSPQWKRRISDHAARLESENHAIKLAERLKSPAERRLDARIEEILQKDKCKR